MLTFRERPRSSKSWSFGATGATETNTFAGDGSYTDATSFKGGGSLTYQVCEAGTSTCSDSVTVIF